MSTHNVFDNNQCPCGPINDPIVDKLLGNAYQVVKYVAMNMPAIKVVSDEIASILAVYAKLKELSDIQAKIPELMEVQAALPHLEVLHTNLVQLLTLYTHIDELVKVATGIDDIHIITPHLQELATVAANITEVVATGTNITKVIAVANSIASVNKLSPVVAEIDALAQNVQALVNINTHLPELLNINHHLPDLLNIETPLSKLVINSFEALRRTYAEAGLVLVSGSFEDGAKVTTKQDVVLERKTGKGYNWQGDIPSDGKVIPAGSTPSSTGGIGANKWVDLSDSLLRDYVFNASAVIFKNISGYSAVDNMVAGRIKDVAGVIIHKAGNIYSTGGTTWKCKIDGATAIGDFKNLTPANVMDFGAKGDGITDDTQAFINCMACTEHLVLPVGTYKIANVTISKTISFIDGAVITGSGIVITGHIDAGNYKIFHSTQDFTVDAASFVQSTHFKILNQERVMVDWFGAKRATTEATILNVPPSEKYFAQAFRAVAGDYIPSKHRPGDFIAENSIGLVGMATGLYNVKSAINWSVYYNGASYWVSGIGMRGDGVNSSRIIATELNFGVGKGILNISKFTGQINPFSDFKVEVYAPQTANPYLGEHAAVIWISSGDSIQLQNIWAAGAQVGKDLGNGFLRNGAGFQFASVVDCQAVNLFAEHNVHNYAVYSSTVSIANCVGFGSVQSQLIFGIPAENYSYPLGGNGGILNLTGAEWHNTVGTAVLAVEPNAIIHASNLKVDGTGESGGPAQGTYFIRAINNGNINGSVKNLYLNDFVYGVAKADGSNSRLGGAGKILTFDGGQVFNMIGTSTTNFPGVISTRASSAINHAVSLNGFSFDKLNPQLANVSGNVTITDVILTSFRGYSDSGADRQLFHISDGDNCIFRNIKRIDNDGRALATTGYILSGKVITQDLNLQNTSKTINGPGQKYEYVPTVYAP